MDILFVYNGWKDSESLRYAMRSIAKNGRNVGRVYLVSDEKPEWCSKKVTHIPYINTRNLYKENDINEAIYTAVEKSDISDHFKPTPRDGSDHALILSVVVDSFACGVDACADCGVGHYASIPYTVDQLILAHNVSSALGQKVQKVEYLGLERYRFSIPQKCPARRVQLTVCKEIAHVPADPRVSRVRINGFFRQIKEITKLSKGRLQARVADVVQVECIEQQGDMQ